MSWEKIVVDSRKRLNECIFIRLEFTENTKFDLHLIYSVTQQQHCVWWSCESTHYLASKYQAYLTFEYIKLKWMKMATVNLTNKTQKSMLQYLILRANRRQNSIDTLIPC